MNARLHLCIAIATITVAQPTLAGVTSLVVARDYSVEAQVNGVSDQRVESIPQSQTFVTGFTASANPAAGSAVASISDQMFLNPSNGSFAGALNWTLQANSQIYPDASGSASATARAEMDATFTLDEPMAVFYRSNTGNGTFTGGAPSHGQMVLRPGSYTASDWMEVSSQRSSTGTDSSNRTGRVDLAATPLRRRLVLATHGWQPLTGSPQSWPARMLPFVNESSNGSAVGKFECIVDNIRDRVEEQYFFEDPAHPLRQTRTPVQNWTPTSHSQATATHWDTWEFATVDWQVEATTLLPQVAAQHARQVGTQIGHDLATAQYKYDQILLIGHSAGSWLIDAIADEFYEHSPDTYVNMSFLDAYVPGARLPNAPFGANQLAEHADYADHYVNMDEFTETNLPLPHAFNIDITDDTAIGKRGHSWPIDWYKKQSRKKFPQHTAYNLGWWNSWIMQPGTSWRDDPSLSRNIFVPEWQRTLEMFKGQAITLPNGDPMTVLPDLANPGGPTQNFTGRNSATNDADKVTVINGTQVNLSVANNGGASAAAPSQTTLLDESTLGELLSNSPFPSTWYEFTIGPSGLDHDAYFTFDFEFTGASDGLLAVYVNDTLAMTALEQWTTGLTSAGWIRLGEGSDDYQIRFELFSGEAQFSEVELTNLALSEAFVPEPSSISLLLALLATHLRRKSRSQTNER